MRTTRLFFILLVMCMLLSACGSAPAENENQAAVQSQQTPMTPLMQAAFDGDLVEVARLLQEGADPNETFAEGSSKGETALLYNACYLNDTSEVPDRTEITRLLLQHGTGQTINAKRNILDDNALMCSVGYGMEQMFDLLLKAGADQSVVNGEGNNLLHVAVNDLKVGFARKLLEMGFDPEARNALGNTALLRVYELCYTEDQKTRIEIMKLLLNVGADINAVNRKGQTLLDEAYYYDSPPQNESIRFLLEHGAKRGDELLGKR